MRVSCDSSGWAQSAGPGRPAQGVLGRYTSVYYTDDMSTRLQVVMSDEEYSEIRVAAERRRLNVSEWVRLVLREARDRDVRARTLAVRESHPLYSEGRSPLARRVRIELDVKEDLLEAVRARFHLSSERAAVEYALARAAVRPMSKEEALSMEGFGWEGDLDALRSGDPPEAW